MRMIKPKRWTHKSQKPRSTITIIAEGKEYQVLMGKFLEGRRRKYGLKKIVPFLGIKTGYQEQGTTFGFKFSDTGYLQSMMAITCSIIHSWRSAVFLVWVIEKAKELDKNILEKCWLLMNTSLKPDYPYISLYIRNIAKMLDPENPDRAENQIIEERNKVLDSIPLIEELEKWIKIACNMGLKIDAKELADEITAGRIAPTPFIKKLIGQGEELVSSESLLNFADSSQT